jgi:hypothetical protein
MKTSIRIIGILDKIRSGYFPKSNALLLQAAYSVAFLMAIVK